MVLCIYTLTLPQGNAIFHFFFLRFIYCKTFFKWYIFHKSLFVWHLSFAKRPDIRKFTRFVERFLIIFFEIIFLVAFNGNYQFVNLQKTIVSPLFNICIMKAVKNVPFCCSRTQLSVTSSEKKKSVVLEWPKIAFCLFPELDSDNLELTDAFIFIILITVTSFRRSHVWQFRKQEW